MGIDLNAANVTINGPASGTLTFEGTTTSLKVRAGTFTAGAGSITVNLAYDQSGGTFTSPNIGGGFGALTVSGAFTLSGGAFNEGTGIVALSSNITISGGTYTANSTGSTTLGGSSFNTFSMTNGTFNAAGTVTFTATTDAISGGTFDGGSATLDFNAPFTLSGGTFILSSGSNLFATTFTISGTPTFTVGTNTVTFDFGNATINSNQAFHHVTINSISTKTLGAALDANGTLTVQAGTFQIGGNTLTAANATVSGGTLSMTGSGGKLKISGSGTLSMSSGAITVADVATPVELTTSDTVTPTYVGVSLTGGTLNILELAVNYLKNTGFVIGSGVTVTNFNKVTWSATSQAGGGTDVMLDITAQTVNLLSHVFPAGWTNGECNVRSNTSGTVSMWDWTGAFGGEDFDCDTSGGEVRWQGGVGGTRGGSGSSGYPAIY
jgi:hypothetical protein